MKWHLEDTGDQGRLLRLQGELTIENAGQVKQALLKALAEPCPVAVDLEAVTEMDLTTLQLFCSAHKTAVADNKRVDIRQPAPEAFRQLVWAAGFLRDGGCSLNPGCDCLWQGERR